MDAMRRLSEAMQKAALAVSSAEGERFFDDLVQALAAILQVEFALISVYVEPQRTHLRTLATYFGGRSARNVEYPIAGTPCERSIGRAFGFFPSGAQQSFPDDLVLTEYGVEGYAAATLNDAHGNPLGVLTVMSRRELAEPALTEAMLKIFAARISAEIERRRSEASYRAIFDATEDAVFIHDFESGATLDVNPKACAAYGYTREEILRMPAGDLSSGEHPYTADEAARLMGDAKRGRVMRFEWRRRNKDGSLHWDEVSLKRVEIAGKPYVLAITREISERKAAEEGLRASEEQYRAIFNATADSLVLRDADFRIVDVNPAYEAAVGLKRDAVLGGRSVTVRFLGSEEKLLALHRRVLAGKRERIEAGGVRQDGQRVHLEMLAVPIQYRGAPHVLYIGRNITERRQAEEALRASEEQYRAIFDAASDSLNLRDAGFRIVDANPAYARMTGYALDEVVGRDFVTTLSLRDAAYARELHGRAIGGETVRVEGKAARKDGTLYDIEVHGVPMTYRGQPHVLYIGRDITERKSAEEALRVSEVQYRAIFNATADSMVLRDAEFRIVDVNAAYEAMSGRRRAEALGRRDVTMSDARLTAQIESLHARALAGERVQWEARAARKNGDPFDIEVRGVPIRHQGRPHVLYIGRDITERKRAEAERVALETQLRQAQKMEAIGQLTGGIAHDFNNILQSILGNLVLASEHQEELGDERLGKYLERARRSSQRARDLIRQMLTFSRGQRAERRRVALAELVREAVHLLRSPLPSSIELRTRLDEGLPQVQIDPVQIEQVLLNLCINARDAMGGSGTIELGARVVEHAGAVCTSCRQRVGGRHVELAVRDSGPGISPEVMDRMFEPFFSTKEIGKGSGMGLAMAHGIVHEQGGHIVVDCVPGEGTVFRLLFPAAAGRAGAAAAAGARPAHASRKRLSGRVLVVDDEEMIREFLSDLLGGWGLEVTALADGIAARDAFASDPEAWDLVITDQTMPRLTGIQLSRTISRIRPGMPIILCTGYAEDLSAREIDAAGVRTLARKPVEPEQIRALLEAHIGRR